MRKNLFTFLVGWMHQTWNLWLDMSLPLSNAMLVLRGSGLCRQSNGTRPLNTMCDGDAITLQGLTFIVNLLQGTLCRLVCMLGRGQMCQLQIGIICRLRSRPSDHPERPITLPLPSMGHYCSQSFTSSLSVSPSLPPEF